MGGPFYYFTDRDLTLLLEEYKEIRQELSGVFPVEEELVWDRHIKIIEDELDRRLSEGEY